jgi:hypothetical protein
VTASLEGREEERKTLLLVQELSLSPEAGDNSVDKTCTLLQEGLWRNDLSPSPLPSGDFKNLLFYKHNLFLVENKVNLN